VNGVYTRHLGEAGVDASLPALPSTTTKREARRPWTGPLVPSRLVGPAPIHVRPMCREGHLITSKRNAWRLEKLPKENVHYRRRYIRHGVRLDLQDRLGVAGDGAL